MISHSPFIGEGESQPCIFNLVAQPLLRQRIVTLQLRDNELEAIRSRLERSEMVENWAIINDELRFRGRLCVPTMIRSGKKYWVNAIVPSSQSIRGVTKCIGT